MDAREYLNRKGVGIDRDPDRPNTLEEKAWARARGAGDGRPKSGTPHDWEDWERYHDDLTDGAQSLDQKIDKEAHRKAVEREQREAKAARVQQGEPSTVEPAPVEPTNAALDTDDSSRVESAVGHFTPQPVPAKPHSDGQSHVSPPNIAPTEPAGLKAAYAVLAVLLPPLSVGLTGAGAKRVVIALVLTLIGWLPGVVYALWWVLRR